MDGYLQEKEKKGGLNMTFVVAFVIGALIVLALIGFIMMRPTTKQIQDQVIENALREGNPEFEVYTKKISIQTDVDRTTESKTGLGTIVMSLRGNIRNMTGKTLTGLEIRAAVVDSFGKPVKEKEILVVPKQTEKLEPGEVFPVQVLMEGFNKDDDRAQIRWKVTAIKVE
jgi:hypothetical protein